VLEALGGYLLIAHHLFQGDGWAATGWNFGPADDDTRPVHWIADRMTASWSALTGQPIGWDQPGDAAGPVPHEAGILKLDCAKARTELGWRPALSLDAALARIVEWHRHVSESGGAREISLAQLADYCQRFARMASEKETDAR
jgi:CDP-glucose 4,6-dehydratase